MVFFIVMVSAYGDMQYNHGPTDEKKKDCSAVNRSFVTDVVFALALALVLVAVVNIIGELAISPRGEWPAVATQETAPKEETLEAAPAEPEPAAKPAVDLASLLAAYDPAAGKKAFRKCKSCHTSGKGGGNRVGPNLWDVVGREKGAVAGFRYSDAMMRKGGAWTYQDLDHFIANPRTFVMGTKMSLKGLSNPTERAALLGFLRNLSDDPRALP